MYQVKILSSKEFDDVAKSSPRYKNVDEDNMGFADPVTNTAYVRHTAFPELNKYLIDHEYSHLVEEHGTDEDEMGIRHKKKKGFANILRTIINPINIPGLGPLSNSDKGIFQTGGGSQEQAQQQLSPQEVAQSYQNSFGTTGAQYGNLGGSPQASQSAPSGNSQDSISGGLYQGGINQQQRNMDPELQKRLSGFFSGRMVF
jgi:hypothetical protein